MSCFSVIVSLQSPFCSPVCPLCLHALAVLNPLFRTHSSAGGAGRVGETGARQDWQSGRETEGEREQRSCSQGELCISGTGAQKGRVTDVKAPFLRKVPVVESQFGVSRLWYQGFGLEVKLRRVSVTLSFPVCGHFSSSERARRTSSVYTAVYLHFTDINLLSWLFCFNSHLSQLYISFWGS